jgi:hypothetical protein
MGRGGDLLKKYGIPRTRRYKNAGPHWQGRNVKRDGMGREECKEGG